MQEAAPQIIVFFDGVCNLCNGFVNFVIQRETAGKIVFASLQSETARKELSESQRQSLESVLVLDRTNRSVQGQSQAILLVLATMGFPWKMASVVGQVIPKPWRDGLYNLVAKNRYRWFGKRETCRLPKPEERARLWD